MSIDFPGVYSLVLLTLAGGVARGEGASYEIAQPGTVSVSVYSDVGEMVRQLVVGGKQEPGTYEVAWDGRDDAGKPLPPGTYSWKGVCADLGVTYHMTVGNTGNPPYRNLDGTGSWGGWNPSSVATDGEHWYLLSRMEEGEGLLMKVDRDGAVLWKTMVPGEINGFQFTGGQMAVACDESSVYVVGTKAGFARAMAQPQEGLWRVTREVSRPGF